MTSSDEFDEIYARGTRRSSGPVVVVTAEAPSPRIGLAVRKGAAGAVGRNRVKRRLRAALDAIEVPRVAAVIQGKPEAAAVPFQELVGHVSRGLRL